MVKYLTIDKEQTNGWKKQIGRVENMTYDEDLDEWICANNKRPTFINEKKRKRTMGTSPKKGHIFVWNAITVRFKLLVLKEKTQRKLKFPIKTNSNEKKYGNG